MKKGFVLFIFTILCILIYSENVEALEQQFSLTAPSQIYISQQAVSQSVDAFMDTWYGNKRVWTGAYYSYSGSTDYIPGGIAYLWNSTSLCAGQTYVLNVDLYTDGDTTFFNEIGPTVYLNGKVCQIIHNSGNAITASCSGLGFENQPLNISVNWGRIATFYFVKVGLGVDTKVTCDVSNGDIINNQNQQTNIIIGSILGSLDRDLSFIDENNDKRKNEIIQNQEKNKQEQIDNANKNQQQTNERLDNINDSLNDPTPPNSDISSLGNVQGLLPVGPVDSLLNIPFEFLSILTSSFGGVCVPLEGNFVFDSKLTIPCFDTFYDEVPTYLMYFINLIPSAFILIKYLKHLYKKIDRAVSMESNADDEWGVL